MPSFSVYHGGAAFVNGLIGGPYALHVVKEDSLGNRKVIASCSCIASPEACDERAKEYAVSYGASIENPMLCQAAA